MIGRSTLICAHCNQEKDFVDSEGWHECDQAQSVKNYYDNMKAGLAKIYKGNNGKVLTDNPARLARQAEYAQMIKFNGGKVRG